MIEQIKIIKNMKKNYLQPKTKVVLVKMEHHLLNPSNPINKEQSGNPDMAKGDIEVMMGKEDFGW